MGIGVGRIMGFGNVVGVSVVTNSSVGIYYMCVEELKQQAVNRDAPGRARTQIRRHAVDCRPPVFVSEDGRMGGDEPRDLDESLAEEDAK